MTRSTNKAITKAAACMMAAVMAFSMAACGSSASTETTAAETETSAETEAAEESEETEAEAEETTGGTLKVAMECAYAPYNWTQSDDSNGAVPISGSSDYAYGYDVMMAKHICEELGWDLEIVKMDWDSLPTSVSSGAIDCAIAGQSITAKRLESVDFTDPYYYASIVTLVKKDGPYKDAKGLADLKGATATSQINTVWYDTCLDQIEDVNKLPAYETTGTMLVSLESGACDLICTDQPTAMAACVAYPDMEMLDFSSSDDNYQVSDEEINIGISVKKGNQELVDEINSVLEKMTKEDYEQMMNEAISVQPLSE